MARASPPARPRGGNRAGGLSGDPPYRADLALERGGGTWHLITVPAEVAAEIRAEGFVRRGGFGSVRVEATINEVTWRTSAFAQKGGGYILPVKAEVRRKAGIAAGDDVELCLIVL